MPRAGVRLSWRSASVRRPLRGRPGVASPAATRSSSQASARHRSPVEGSGESELNATTPDYVQSYYIETNKVSEPIFFNSSLLSGSI
ncbi:hypothetical protein GUJ93_ZPchr0002g26576 [Zizania palustris]|uniref:Uncharacterized protein n=1 Tax=Zizania palustris TaxID=103762 RepID=A0A8J5S3Q7_ZIZPA|nr:hypothetical protein GUJ93_ZPchr0002g26576 [Zizania palustris]